MNIIETTVPISVDNLKKYFTDKNIFYKIDYEKSELKGKNFITYLSNLDLPCDVINIDIDLINEYFNSTSLVNISALENIAIDILLRYKKLNEIKIFDDFIDNNKKIIDKWCNKLESLIVYNMYMINSEEFRNYAKSFEKNDTNEIFGINFISLLKNERFYLFYNKIISKLKFYTHYFDDYMFKGKNMYSYWAVDKNPMFLITWAIAAGKGNEFIEAKIKNKEFIENVASF
jgi:hypothetical protein